MANIYDGAFRTILNDCRKLIIPIINEIFWKHTQGKKKFGFYPMNIFQTSRTRQITIELSGDVIKEIAQKYENVQKGVGDMMSGALIETNARRLKSEAENETKKETALRMLQDGELSIDKIAKYSGLRVEDVEELAGLQTV